MSSNNQPQIYQDLMAGFEELGQFVRDEKELRVTNLHSVTTSQPREYVILFEKGPRTWSATVPDWPGCVAIGATLEEAEYNIRAALTQQAEELRQLGTAIPEPLTQAKSIRLAA